jgi:hypothetical protein
MKIEIDHNVLSDSPLNDKNKSLFSSINKSTNDLIEDIVNGNPTCYLVSGYRGAGKSSFIKQVEAEIQKIQPILKKEIVFVYTNFSAYNDQTFFLRKLIRGLYHAIKDLSSFTKLKSDEDTGAIKSKKISLIEQLYDKTFYDTSVNTLNSERKENTSVLTLNWMTILKLIVPLSAVLFFSLNWIGSFFNLEGTFNFLLVALSGILSISGAIEINQTISKSKIAQIDFARKSLYDNEIADYHFLSILSLFQKEYKIIFVLDELDKVPEERIDNLLNEMKPYLVSGLSGFIVVAGQKLYYKYSSSKRIDDALLSSMFSKFIHIALLSRIEFHLLFRKMMKDGQQLTESEEKSINTYLDFLVFESKRIPRRFINLIRENLVWENGKAFLYVDDFNIKFERYVKANKIIEEIDDKDIATQNFDEAVRDYCVMQLYLKCNTVLNIKKDDFSFNEILNDTNG